MIRAVLFLPESILNEKNILGAMKELLKKRDSTGREEKVRRQSCQDAEKKKLKSTARRGEKYDYAAPELQ